MKSLVTIIATIYLVYYNPLIAVHADPTTTSTVTKIATLCEASATQHCTATGYDRCKVINNVQSCYCAHQQNWTSVIDVIDKDLHCSITSSKYLDPHYWFQDLLAASIIIMVIFTAITWAYLIPTYAKIDAMYDQKTYKAPLKYIPLLPRNTYGDYSILPSARSRK